MGLQDMGISSIPGYIYIFEVADEPKKHDLLIGEQKLRELVTVDT